MILGTYWFSKFPDGLYKFDYFEFQKGFGGFVDKPAELITIIEAEHPDMVIADMQDLVNQHNDAFIFINQEQFKLKIGTGGYQLFDFDFELIVKAENRLKRHKAWLAENKTINPSKAFKLTNTSADNKIVYPTEKFIQIVGSDYLQYNSENSKIRIDCNLKYEYKHQFLEELEKCCFEEKIDVFYFYQKETIENKCNLMLFFTNGRQGVDLTEKISTNVRSFEKKIKFITDKLNVEFGHLNVLNDYPLGEPTIILMKEKEFII